MTKYFLLFLFFIGCFSVKAQYTETINTNRPGSSQGAFSVGRDVLQFEAGIHYGKDDHALTEIETELLGTTYEARFGLFWEQLEINVRGDFVQAEQHFVVGNEAQSVSFRNFEWNVVGVKLLIYDPYRRHFFDKPNLYSWKANQRFKWWKLLPAVAIYGGANLTFGDRPEPYPFFGSHRSDVSPIAALITQHNWGGTVLVMNFIGDRLTDDHKRYSGIVTLTQNLGKRFSLFGEFQTIYDDFYSDDLVRFGGAYLLTRNWQVDLSGMTNFKDTPERWALELGLSYRFDLHYRNVRLKDPDENKKKRYTF